MIWWGIFQSLLQIIFAILKSFFRVITFMSSELQSSGFVEISVATLAGASNCAFIHMHFIYLFIFSAINWG